MCPAPVGPGIWDVGYGIVGCGIWDMGRGMWDVGYGMWDVGQLQYNQYIKGFLALNPDTPLSDIPRFEDFDVDRDGVVTFAEWQYYLDQNRQVQSLV